MNHRPNDYINNDSVQQIMHGLPNSLVEELEILVTPSKATGYSIYLSSNN